VTIILPLQVTLRDSEAGCWWLTPVILVTLEAEIRRITVQSQSRKDILRTPFSN
jgi:hypothetical protein